MGGGDNLASDWSILTELADKNTVTPDRVSGASSEFKREEAEHRTNAERIMKTMNSTQMEALKKAGIRDVVDAGEFLHETASWERQVEHMAEAIDKNIAIDERRLIENGRNNGLNPITGERVGDSLFVPVKDENGEKSLALAFQGVQESMLSLNSREAKAMGDLIRDKLQLNEEQDEAKNKVPEPYSREDLELEAIDSWKAGVLNDEDKRQKVESSVYYATLKRKIQKEAEKITD